MLISPEITELVQAIETVRRAFGAPGDHGYETREGKALYALYNARARLWAAIDHAEFVEATVFPETLPTDEGCYWARWHTPAPGTADEGEPCCGISWDVVLVFVNQIDRDNPDHLRVMVLGVEKSQPLDAFEWGEEVKAPDYARAK